MQGQPTPAANETPAGLDERPLPKTFDDGSIDGDDWSGRAHEDAAFFDVDDWPGQCGAAQRGIP